MHLTLKVVADNGVTLGDFQEIQKVLKEAKFSVELWPNGMNPKEIRISKVKT